MPNKPLTGRYKYKRTKKGDRNRSLALENEVMRQTSQLRRQAEVPSLAPGSAYEGKWQGAPKDDPDRWKMPPKQVLPARAAGAPARMPSNAQSERYVQPPPSAPRQPTAPAGAAQPPVSLPSPPAPPAQPDQQSMAGPPPVSSPSAAPRMQPTTPEAMSPEPSVPTPMAAPGAVAVQPDLSPSPPPPPVGSVPPEGMDPLTGRTFNVPGASGTGQQGQVAAPFTFNQPQEQPRATTETLALTGNRHALSQMGPIHDGSPVTPAFSQPAGMVARNRLQHRGVTPQSLEATQQATTAAASAAGMPMTGPMVNPQQTYQTELDRQTNVAGAQQANTRASLEQQGYFFDENGRLIGRGNAGESREDFMARKDDIRQMNQNHWSDRRATSDFRRQQGQMRGDARQLAQQGQYDLATGMASQAAAMQRPRTGMDRVRHERTLEQQQVGGGMEMKRLRQIISSGDDGTALKAIEQYQQMVRDGQTRVGAAGGGGFDAKLQQLMDSDDPQTVAKALDLYLEHAKLNDKVPAIWEKQWGALAQDMRTQQQILGSTFDKESLKQAQKKLDELTRERDRLIEDFKTYSEKKPLTGRGRSDSDGNGGGWMTDALNTMFGNRGGAGGTGGAAPGGGARDGQQAVMTDPASGKERRITLQNGRWHWQDTGQPVPEQYY